MANLPGVMDNDSGEEEIYPPNRGNQILEDDVGEFFIPSDKSDLLNDESQDGLTFSAALELDDVMEDLGDNFGLRDAVKKDGICALRKKFQVVCSTIWHFDTMDFEFLEAFMKGLLAVFDLAVDRLNATLCSSGIRKKAFRSDLKIALFLLCHYIDALQHLIAERSEATSKKTGKRKNHLDERGRRLRCSAFSALRSATDSGLNWSALWQTGAPEKEFKTWLLNMVMRYCSDIDLLSHKTEESAFLAKIIGNVYMLDGISTEFWKSVMTLFRKNDCGTFFAEVVNHIYSEKGMDVMEDVFETMESNMDEIAATSIESSIGMSYANLLKGFAKNHPIPAASCLDELRQLLMCNAASVRSACVQLLASAIECQTKHALPGVDRRYVKDWWSLMLAQIMDSNSNVRNKVLSCVSDLSEKNCISNSRFLPVLQAVVGRVGCNDHTSTTRRAALLCLTELLRGRPELLKCTLAETQLKFCERTEKLIESLPTNVVEAFMKPWISQQSFITMSQQLSDAAIVFVKTKEIRRDIREIVRGMDYKRIMERLADCLEVSDGTSAFYYFMVLASKCPDEKIVADYHLQSFLGEHAVDVPAHRLLSLSDCLESVFLANPHAAERSESFRKFLQLLCSDDNETTRKLADAVVRSQQDISARRLLTECVPVLENTLQMCIVSDITEISSFLIFADASGFKEGASVLRRLPSFFTSQNKDVKGAALQAYRNFFIGNTANLARQQDELVEKLLHELPCISAPNSHAVRLMFKDEKDTFMKGIAKKLINIAVSSDNNDDVWRACLALTVLPKCTDKEMEPHIPRLQKKCLSPVTYDPRLICTFCDVLIKVGRSPLEVEDPNERRCEKVIMPAQSLLDGFLGICIMAFTNEADSGKTQMLGKIAEALFAVSESPITTLRALVHFVLMRLKIGDTLLNKACAAGHSNGIVPGQAVVDEGDPAEDVDTAASATVPEPDSVVPFQGLYYVLFFGASAVFTFANWMEDVFSINIEAKKSEEKRPAGEIDENEPDGPTEEDRGKAMVVQLRKSLFEGSNDGINSGIPVIERMIVNLTMNSSTIHGETASLVAFAALIRLMLIHETYCSRHIKRVLHVLETTESLELKKVLLIGFSDIAVRFVNLVQPYTDNFTRQLRHSDPAIRYHALMSFVRIIVNDLVKVREQHCDIAMLIRDPDEQVASVTMGFFKDKIPPAGIMNIIPQMLAREDLHKSSDPAKIQEVMAYLIELTAKNDTTIHALVDLFFQTLEGKRPVETWRLAGHCLVLVAPHITEKLVTQIREQVFAIKKATKDDTTLGYLVDAFQVLKRKLPEEKKRIAEDTIKKLEQLSQDNAEVDEKRPARSAAKQSLRGTRTQCGPSTSRGGGRATGSTRKPTAKPKSIERGARAAAKEKGRTVGKHLARQESESSSESEDSPAPARKAPAKRRARISSSSEE